MATKRKKPAKRTPKRKPKCGTPDGKTRVQSLAFSKTRHAKGKPKWTPTRAKKWAKDHNYKAKKVDTTASEYRVRQHAPSKCEYRSRPFGSSGIRAIIEAPHVRRAVEEELVAKRR